jgi:hypothetical protein
MKITITKGSAWYEGLVGDSFTVYEISELTGEEMMYTIDPVTPNQSMRFVRSIHCEISERVFVKVLCKEDVCLGAEIKPFLKDQVYAAEVFPDKLRSWGERITRRDFVISKKPVEECTSDPEFTRYFELLK